MNLPAPVIATHWGGDPEVAPMIIVVYKKTKLKRYRVLIGWNHQNDTAEGLKEGKLWCWVSQGGQRLVIYDTGFNRSKIPGDPHFCGPANFTMIRMFHPYWCPQGNIPKDMDSADKEYCRQLYDQLIRRLRIDNGQEVDSESGDAVQPRGARGRNRNRPANRAQPSTRRRQGRRNNRSIRGETATDQEEPAEDQTLEDSQETSDDATESDNETTEERSPSPTPRRACAADVDGILSDFVSSHFDESQGDALRALENPQDNSDQTRTGTPAIDDNNESEIDEKKPGIEQPLESDMFFGDDSGKEDGNDDHGANNENEERLSGDSGDMETKAEDVDFWETMDFVLVDLTNDEDDSENAASTVKPETHPDYESNEKAFWTEVRDDGRVIINLDD